MHYKLNRFCKPNFMFGTTFNEVICFITLLGICTTVNLIREKLTIQINKTKSKPNLYTQFESKGFQKQMNFYLRTFKQRTSFTNQIKSQNLFKHKRARETTPPKAHLWEVALECKNLGCTRACSKWPAIGVKTVTGMLE